MTLTAKTVDENLALAEKYKGHIDMVELRADHLNADEVEKIADFPAQCKLPAILTVRRERDGGAFKGSDKDRLPYFSGLTTFTYVDIECDNESEELETLAKQSNVRIIRSKHDFEPKSGKILSGIDAIARGDDEIVKLAFMPRSLNDVTDLFIAARNLPGRDRIICAMGNIGTVSRILARRLGSYLTFTSPVELLGNIPPIGHIDPIRLNEVFNIRGITDATSLCGVTGWPLAVTASPEVHRNFYNRDGLDAVMIPLPSEKIEDALRFAKELNFKGLAVTIPHKNALLSCVDELDNAVKQIGAANTVVFSNGKTSGYNTDAGGFAKALTDFLGVSDLTGKRVAVLGAGGAAKGVVCAIASLRGDATVYARNIDKAKEISTPYGFAAKTLTDLTADEHPYLIVQCTSVGLGSVKPEDDPIPGYHFTGDEYLYDIIYKPAVTPLMARAQKAGARTECGLSMLREQAELQHALFFGCR